MSDLQNVPDIRRSAGDGKDRRPLPGQPIRKDHPYVNDVEAISAQHPNGARRGDRGDAYVWRAIANAPSRQG